MRRYAIGVDVGGTTVKLGLFSADGALLEKWEIPTNTQDDGVRILPDVAASVSAVLAQKGISHQDVIGIGVGIPGAVNAAGIVHKCDNLGWGMVDVRARLSELLPHIPNIDVGNDANVAALGELRQGVGKDYTSAVMFTLGTGVGGGVVLNGAIVSGTNGAAGEVGHFTVEPQETEVCGCGKRGCLEQYASANGIVRLAGRMLAACDTPSALRSMDKYTSKDICDLARNGEEMAGAIFDRCAHYLGLAMSWVGCTVNPQVFIIGGGMSRAGKMLADAVARHYQTYVFRACKNTPFVIAQLGNDAGIYGCARLVLK